MKTAWWRRAARAVAELPWGLRTVIAATVVLHGIGLTWGMPASDGWDVDGIAPRDVFPGVALTFAPGHFFTYPPLHLTLLALLSLPELFGAVLAAGTTEVSAVIHTIIDPVFMTPIAMTARIVTLGMSVGIVIAIAKAAEELSPPARKRRAGMAAGALAAAGAPFTYYSHVTNLDVPYLFWAWLSVLEMVRATTRGEPARLRTAGVFAALAITTKDQAYAIFLGGAPAAVVGWMAVDRARARRIATSAAQGALIAAAIVLFVDDALLNPRGFVLRLGFLSGSASRDYAMYSADLAGRASALADMGAAFGQHYPWAVLPVAVLGAGVALTHAWSARRAGGGPLIAAALPLLVAASFTAFFNLVALRVEHRFMLPQILSAALYGGLGLERLGGALGRREGWARGLGVAAVAAVLTPALWKATGIDANLLADARYDAEAWLKAHARSGDAIEMHGLSVYAIRFWPGAHVARVGEGPTQGRNPLPGVIEVQDRLSRVDERRPRFVVDNSCYAGHYLGTREASAGRIVQASLRRDDADEDATTFFRGLFDHRFRYRLAHESRMTSALFEPVDLHASLGCKVWVFERDGE